MKSIEERIKEATTEIESALLENVLASKAETNAKIRRRKAHYTLQKSSERLNDLRKELMEIN